MILALLLQLATVTVGLTGDAGANITLTPTNDCNTIVTTFTLEPGQPWQAPVEAANADGQPCTYNVTANADRNDCTANGGGTVTAGASITVATSCPQAVTPTPIPPLVIEPTPEPTPWPTPTSTPTSAPLAPTPTATQAAPPGSAAPTATPSPIALPRISEPTQAPSLSATAQPTPILSAPTALSSQTPISCHAWECQLWGAPK